MGRRIKICQRNTGNQATCSIRCRLLWSAAAGRERPPTSSSIIRDTGEFVINLVNKRLVRATDYCGVKSGRDVDKFKETRLTPQASRYVKAPGVEESPVNIECRVAEVKELGSHDMFIAKVMGVTIDNQYMDDRGKFNLNASGLVSYSHGEYFELGKKLGSFGYTVKKPVKRSNDKNRTSRRKKA